MATANATGASTGIYSYGPYGEPNTTTGPRFRYIGQQLIGELGLYYYKARFYSPSLGRFLQTDPCATRTTSTCMPTWATPRRTGPTPPD
ncbi:RHS repeat-associated core domain-containing protein [Variovorax sp. WS11]|uniref:RHS repeat-associated core domain-containing protein n=1 Tax=Variovorax sp. WS11 TaxID=1105204 RepID=UPI001EF369E5|nr:RHS repeat-associated core domain-containing protein [Variovorax sp. WS11]